LKRIKKLGWSLIVLAVVYAYTTTAWALTYNQSNLYLTSPSCSSVSQFQAQSMSNGNGFPYICFDNTVHNLFYWNGAGWTQLSGGSSTPTPTPTPTPTATPTPGPGPTFIGRTQVGVACSSAAPVSISPDAGVSNGNQLVVFLASYQGSSFASFTPPSGWTQQGSDYVDGNGDHLGLYTHTYESGDTVPYVWTVNTSVYTEGCEPKLILRDYSNVTGIDVSAGTGTGNQATCTIPQLTATAGNNETYVGLMANNSNPIVNYNAVSGWSDTTSDNSYWGTYEGDFAIPTAGTVPAAQVGTMVSSSTAFQACAGITLK
jgi:hypothetical protein